MPVFSSVTATLSPELAYCMKAKGRTWKDAFFDSLKTLVGVEYAVYRRESQWQIKGEWSAVKKAHSILAKVEVIEKESIAAYQEAASKINAREVLPTPTADGLLEAARPRRRGRPPKHRPSSPTTVNKKVTAGENAALPPKRKRGRPRKVKTEEFKEESDIDNDGDSWDETKCKVESHPEENGGSQDDRENSVIMVKDVQEIGTGDKTAETSRGDCYANTEVHDIFQSDKVHDVKTNVNYHPNHQNTQSPTTELSTKRESSVNQGKSFEQDVTNQSVLTSINPEQGVPFSSNNHEEVSPHVLSTSFIPSAGQSVPESQQSYIVRDSSGPGPESKPNTTSTTHEIPEHPETHEFSHRGAQEESHAMQVCGETVTKPTSIGDDFSEVVIAAAKEALACANVINDGTQSEKQTLVTTDQPQESTDDSKSDGVENSQIFDYLGIKQKTNIDEFADDSERFTNEQSKKLEELIEKMIEKMDRTLTEAPKAKGPSGLKYICTECPFTSGKKGQLRDHMRQAHMEIDEMIAEAAEDVPVPPTEYKVTERRRLGPRRLYRCFECSYTTNSRKHLREHKKRKHGEKTLECEVCLKKFAVSRDLARHMKDHEGGSSRFSCEICGKKYKQHYVLKRHQETHKDGYVKPVYPCNLCPKTFAAKQVLQIHLNSVHLGKKMSFPCPTCGKDFTTKHSLAEHQLIHTNTKPYKCGICHKAFRHESTLKTHERLHTDTTQQFTCEYCGKAFRLRSSLRIHRNIHTGDKRFECPVCKKVFTQKQSLLRHARIHTGEKPFQCEICGSAFYDYSILRRHVTGVHKMQWKSPTQHYVLPPDNYKDGKVIETPQEAMPPPVQSMPQLPPASQVVTHVVEAIQASMIPQSQVAQQSHIYQPPPVSHTPHTAPQPTHTSQAQISVQNLSSRHIQPNKTEEHQQQTQLQPQQMIGTKVTAIGESQHLPSFHANILNQNIYQAQHVPLPNTLPSNITISQPSTIQSSTPTPQQQQQQQQHQEPPPMQSPPPHPLSPLTPMTLAQYQPQTLSQPTNTPLSLQSAYTLSQHLYYQSHH